jgi:hypothetical protein
VADELRQRRERNLRVTNRDQADLEEREPHVQTVDETDIYQLPQFSGAQFVAHIKRDMRITASGDLEVIFTVPYKFKHLAYSLSDVMARPLSVDVQTWKPYEDAMEGT